MKSSIVVKKRGEEMPKSTTSVGIVLYTDERIQIYFDFYQKSVLMKRRNSLDITHCFSSFFSRCTQLVTGLIILQLETSDSTFILLF